MIRVLLVDDHAAFRQPLAFMLAREPDITVVGHTGALAEARTMLKNVDVAVVDLDIGGDSGLHLIREIYATHCGPLVLLLTASADRREIAHAVEAGAAGLLHKSASIDDIIAAVRRLACGESLLSTKEVLEMLRLAREVREQDHEAQTLIRQLTARERDVLQSLADGLTDKDIGQQLHISPETARTHMVNILNKLGVKSRLQALVFAVRHGVVRING